MTKGRPWEISRRSASVGAKERLRELDLASHRTADSLDHLDYLCSCQDPNKEKTLIVSVPLAFLSQPQLPCAFKFHHHDPHPVSLVLNHFRLSSHLRSLPPTNLLAIIITYPANAQLPFQPYPHFLAGGLDLGGLVMEGGGFGGGIGAGVGAGGGGLGFNGRLGVGSQML